jgi:hypothetical protein
MAHPLGLRPEIIPTLIPRPVPRVLDVRHTEQPELLVRADTSRQPIVHAADHGERLAAWHVDFVHWDFDDGPVGGAGDSGGGGLEVFSGEGG